MREAMDWTRRPQSKPAMQKMERKEIKDNAVQALRILKKIIVIK